MRLKNDLSFRHINDVAVFEFVGRADAFSFVRRLVAVFRRSVAVDFLALLCYDFHVFLAGILHHCKVFLRKHLSHVVPADECHHKCYGKYHCDVEEVAHHAHGVAVLASAE